MIQFNELTITPDNKELIIDVSIQDFDEYSNVFLDSLYIDNQDTFVNDGPSRNAIYTYSFSGDNKHYRLVLSTEDIQIPNNLFFIYVVTKGDSKCPEINISNRIFTGVVFNSYSIFKYFMKYIRDIETKCEISNNFADSILKYKAFSLSILTGNYQLTIKYWNKFFRDYIRGNNDIKECLW